MLLSARNQAQNLRNDACGLKTLGEIRRSVDAALEIVILIQ
jgi:hypothetical protein